MWQPQHQWQLVGAAGAAAAQIKGSSRSSGSL